MLTHVADKSQSVFEGTALLIKQVFDFAYENHDVLKHPCQKTKTGGIPPAERDALTPEQVSILLDAVKETRAYLFLYDWYLYRDAERRDSGARVGLCAPWEIASYHRAQGAAIRP